jgi:MoCo/4Fe-4S cofactor protein with predicted Tat translocation signal
MNDNNKKYWKGVEELSNDPEFLKNAHKEFPDFLPLKEEAQVNSESTEDSGTDRRDFLKLLGFGVAAASLAACETPVNRAIPYLNKPEEVDPGIANWYASTYLDGGEYCSILVKTREGRPIKIEGNSLSSITKGGTSARVQASVLSLYDEERLKFFTKNGKALSLDEYGALDNEIVSKLTQAQQEGKGIRIVSSTIMSPSTKKVIADFKAKYPAAQHIMYDANSVSGLIKANKSSFGKVAVPSYDFSKANVIVSFGADFLGTWISPIEYAKGYAKNRKLGKSKKTMNKHYQFETNLSLTGSNADYRTPIKPSQEGLYVAALYNRISGSSIDVKDVKDARLEEAARDLMANRGKSLVVSGSNDVAIQTLVNAINSALGNYGETIDLNTPSYQRQGDDAAMAAFVEDVKSDAIGAVIFYNTNPVYDHPMGAELGGALKKVGLKISIADKANETASLENFIICPDYHYLESWNDAEPKKGFYSLAQPTISPLYKGTRCAQESLLIWSGNKQDYYSYIQNNWKQLLSGSFQDAWDKAVHDGVYESGKTMGAAPAPVAVESKASDKKDNKKDKKNKSKTVVTANAAPAVVPVPVTAAQGPDLNEIANAINEAAKGGEIELKLYEKVGIGTGSQSNNPWLQELPDPISKATWDNYLAVPLKMAQAKGWKQGDVVSVAANGKEAIKVPVLIQPGQANDTASLAIGYGRTKAGRCGNNIGANAYPFVSLVNGSLNYTSGKVVISSTGETTKIAQTQTHHTIMARPVIQDSILANYVADPKAGRHFPTVNTKNGPVPASDPSVDLWKAHEKPNHHWGMVIDLNSCIGCGACVVACQSENNIPVVGKKEVLNRREMHWMRIDRYYSSTEQNNANIEGDFFKGDPLALELPEENPEVTFQPMLCQHCNHAPCETVCPVAATNHSSEGLNQMAYNRCIGTRYCANNCPYKVRRFNWFKYFENDQFDKNSGMNSIVGRMVLNPDVTVRSRGVMEKCTFCVQRIQEGKLNAKREKRRPIDGEIVAACSSACPTEAIVFGDMNDKESKVSVQLTVENFDRAYHVLEEVNTKPNVSYLTKIRNKKA